MNDVIGQAANVDLRQLIVGVLQSLEEHCEWLQSAEGQRELASVLLRCPSAELSPPLR